MSKGPNVQNSAEVRMSAFRIICEEIGGVPHGTPIAAAIDELQEYFFQQYRKEKSEEPEKVSIGAVEYRGGTAARVILSNGCVLDGVMNLTADIGTNEPATVTIHALVMADPK